MSNVRVEMATYFQHIRGRLSCTRRYQDEQMQKIFRAAEEYAQENPNATPEEVEMYLGDPAEVAQALMESIDPAEIERYQKRKKLGVLLVIGVLAIALGVMTTRFVYLRSQPAHVEVIETLVIHD